jgi:hypothetical protein
MPFKKIFRAPRKFVRKVIPKEIRPFVPYIAAGMVGPTGLPSLGIKSQGLSRALLAGLTRGVVDDEADFRDVLRTGVTAALPNIIKSGSNMLAAKLDPQLAADVAENIDEASAIYANKGNVVEGASLKEKLASGLSKIGQSKTLGALTDGGINKETVGAIITAGSADQARKLISEYEEGLDGPYDRKNDRGALFAIFQNAQWGTDDEINDMLDRYGYMGGGSVMPIQTGIAGALPMANTRPGYDNGGGIKMASAVLGGEEDDIAYELFGKPYKDLTPAEIQEFQEEMDRLEKKFMKKDSKENMLMASAPDPAAERNDMLEEMSLKYYKKPLKELTPNQFLDLEEALDDMGSLDKKGDKGLMANMDIIALEFMQKFGYDIMLATPDVRENFIQEWKDKNFYNKSEAPTEKRVMAAEGGIMDLGGMEKDYRNEGGFVPIGEKERADDVPARLSLNEFVMTADAVRNAGDGDIDKGAEVMENVMKNLEEGGSISEESQGKEGARRMFNTMEGMEAVI